MYNTLITAFLNYITYEKKYSNHTYTAYSTDLTAFQKYCNKHFKETNIEQANYQHIRFWIVALVNKGISNRTVNRKISSLKSFYDFMLKIEEIKSNPLATHKALKTQNNISIPFTEKEVTQVTDELKDKSDFEELRNYLIIELLYSTGIRKAELINIKEEDLDLNSKTLKILAKKNKERYVILLPYIVKTIKLYLNQKSKLKAKTVNNYLLITKKGVKLYETLVYRIVNTYFSKVSPKAKKSPHILRHTFASHLLNNGASLNSVKELLGHSSLASTQVYTHSSLEEIKKVFHKTHPRGSS
ncbi:MAG: tyrosine-type recombinase/integrase [Tenacibaculum sp.]